MASLVVYDLDGTLVDSARTVAAILNEMRVELGREPRDEATLTPWLSLGGEDLIRNALNLDSDLQVTECLKEFRARYLQRPTDSETIYPGVQATLRSLRDHGALLAICTNKPRPLAEKVLEDTGLGTFFDFMNAGGDLTNRKPDPDNLLSCLEFYKISRDETFFVGDSHIDQTMAQRADVPFIFFRSGYNDGVSEEAAFAAIEHHTEILPFVTFVEDVPQ